MITIMLCSPVVCSAVMCMPRHQPIELRPKVIEACLNCCHRLGLNLLLQFGERTGTTGIIATTTSWALVICTVRAVLRTTNP